MGKGLLHSVGRNERRSNRLSLNLGWHDRLVSLIIPPCFIIKVVGLHVGIVHEEVFRRIMVATRILMVASSHIVGELNLTILVNISDKASLSAALGTCLFWGLPSYVFL